MTANNNVVLGIDLGGTQTKIGFVQKDGRVLGWEVFSSLADRDFIHFINKLKERFEALKNSIRRHDHQRDWLRRT